MLSLKSSLNYQTLRSVDFLPQFQIFHNLKEDNDDDFDDFDSTVLELSAIEENIKFILTSLRADSGVTSIITKAMLYSLMCNKTQVDKDLANLRQSNKIMRFPFRSSSPDYVMLFTDYVTLLKKQLLKYHIASVKVIEALKKQCDVIYFSKVDLKGKLCLSDDAIKSLTHDKFLLLNADMTYEFSVPCSGNYVELLSQGKARILNVLQNRPSNEILEQDLLEMKLKKCALGIKFLLYDLIGNGQVKSVKCGMGNLIRLIKR